MTTDPLAPLLDRAAIEDLAHGYGIGCDDRDADLLGTLFATGARAHYGAATTLAGPDAIVDWLLGQTATVTWSQHVITPRAVTLDGDTAACRATLLARQVFADDPNTLLVTAGEYHLVLGSGPAGWRIEELTLSVGWSGPGAAAGVHR